MTDDNSAVTALRGPQHTLTISLEARARASRWPDPVITDPEAERLTDLLDLHTDYSGFPANGTVIGTAVRTEIFDEQVRTFVTARPGATVLTIGAGLCTRHARLAQLPCTWVDVDLPDVVRIREQMLPATTGRRVVAASATEPAAIASLVGELTEPALIVVEGLSMYLTEENVQTLLRTLAGAPASSRILLEAMGEYAVRSSIKHRSVRDSGAEFVWGVDDFSTVAAWDDRLRLVGTEYYMDRHARRWPGLFRLMRFVPMFRRQSKIGILDVAA